MASTDQVLKELSCFIYTATNDQGRWVSTYVGNSIERLTGVSIDEFVSGKKDWLQVVHEDDRVRVLKEGLLLLDAPQSLTQEYRINHVNGDVFWIRDIKRSSFEDGQFVVSGIAMDITKQKLIEEKNRQLLREIIGKNNQLQEMINSTQFLNNQILNENKLIKETAALQIETDVLPLLDRITGEQNQLITDAIRAKLENLFSDAFEEDFNLALTRREQEICALVKSGMTQNDMAEKLDLGVNTIKTHVKNIKKKLMLNKDETLYQGLARY